MANLEKVEHIGVLMLENRSFDHTLGYLSLEGARNDVDGLRGEFANEHNRRNYPIYHLDSTAIADDPDHSAASVDLQIGGGAMNGFVTSFADTLTRRGIKDGDPAPVMGYYSALDVPVYDHLAREFAVCDRWFSSVPGATWPNRLYAICGQAAGSRDDLPHNRPPLYNRPSFVRHLDAHGVTWRWYSFEAGTLRFADAHYTLGHHDRFAFFSKTHLNWKTAIERIDWVYLTFDRPPLGHRPAHPGRPSPRARPRRPPATSRHPPRRLRRAPRALRHQATRTPRQLLGHNPPQNTEATTQ